MVEEMDILAVDGGGTGCRGVLCRRQPPIVRIAQGAAVNYHAVGAGQAEQSLTSLLRSLTGGAATKVKCAVFGLAGLDTAADRITLTSMLRRSLAAAAIRADAICLDNDVLVTLRGEAGGGAGIIVAAGTGSIVWGLATDGRTARAGGWGYRVGDEGSGYDLGRQALSHVLHVYDGRAEQSRLAAAVLAELGVADTPSLLDWVYGPDFTVQRTAALATVVMRLAETGDGAAQAIVSAGAIQLASAALAVFRRLELGNSSVTLVTSGGLLRHKLLHTMLLEQLSDVCRPLASRSLAQPPLCSAVRYGYRMAGMDEQEFLEDVTVKVAHQLREWAVTC